ncbi:MAG: hypothetical protein AB7P14_08950 [Blastocatellales bacterium]
MKQEHNPSNGNQKDEVLCVGLPFTGNRNLTPEELANLRSRRLRLLIAAVAWMVAIPFWLLLGLTIGFLAQVMELAVAGSNSFSQIVFLLLAIGGLLVGVPVSILKAKDCFHYAAVLYRTIRAGSVRQFVGKFDPRFWNEDTLEQLLKKLIGKRPIEPDATDALDIEVYPLDEYVYAFNRNLPNSFFPIHLTIASARPPGAARFRAPAEFQPETEENVVERRRLTTEEQKELQSYARQTLRRSLIYSPICLWFVTSVAWKVSTRFLSWNTSKFLTSSLLLIAAIALFLQARKWVTAYRHDAENGWVLIVEYPAMDESETNIGHQPATVEFLIHAGHEWTIDGKPASWRKKVSP